MPADTTRPYEVRAVSERRVEAASKSPLAYEAKGWQESFRRDLRTALRTLVAGPGDVLHAVYVGRPDPSPADAENVLFGNVGTGAFSSSAAAGLRFERVFLEATAVLERARFPHATLYELAPRDGGFRYARRGPEIASWDSVALVAMNRVPNVSDVWSAIRASNSVRVEPQGIHGGYFGLALRLAAPRPPNAAAIVKPVLDGVVAAFSAHDGADLEEVSRRIGRDVGRSESDVASDLGPSPRAVLGRQRLVVRTKSSVHWLPPDDRCMACELLVEPGTGPTWQLSGVLFAALAPT